MVYSAFHCKQNLFISGKFVTYVCLNTYLTCIICNRHHIWFMVFSQFYWTHNQKDVKKNFQLKVWYIWRKIAGKIKKWAIHYFFQFLNKSIWYFFQTIQGIFLGSYYYYWQNVWSHENLELFRNNYFLTRISALVKEMGGNVFRNYEFWLFPRILA